MPWLDPTDVPLPPSPPLARTEAAPAPSLRPARSIPANVFITGVDVESADWQPGQIRLGRGCRNDGRGKKGKQGESGVKVAWKDYADGKVDAVAIDVEGDAEMEDPELSGLEDVTPGEEVMRGH